MAMIDIKKSDSTEAAEQGGKSWQFWFLVTFSVLLIITFVWYLPLRFQFMAREQAEEPVMVEKEIEDHPHPEEIEEDHHFNLRNLLVDEVFANGDDVHEDEVDDHPHAPGTPEEHAHGEGSQQMKPLVSPEWWFLLVVSLIAIAILSFLVHKFITVKE
ncbi:hypothetical protein IID24_03530 [Patescibacteria group bacterium]|nr:hypothetical protein [Patescibacteria group bacterium]